MKRTTTLSISKAIVASIVLFFYSTTIQALPVKTGDDASSTPVKYTSFSASVSSRILLDWTTAQETNSSHFEVERSFDNSNFKTVGLVLDALTINGDNKTYKFKENTANLEGNTVAYYRLKLIDNDGKSNYSSVLVVRIASKTTAATTTQITPNPFSEKFYVRFAAKENGNAEVRIVSVTGQTILSKQSQIIKGNNSILMDGVNNLSKGIYVAQIYVNGGVIDNQKLIKN